MEILTRDLRPEDERCRQLLPKSSDAKSSMPWALDLPRASSKFRNPQRRQLRLIIVTGFQAQVGGAGVMEMLLLMMNEDTGISADQSS